MRPGLGTVIATLLSLTACGASVSYRCIARHPMGGYADSCEPEDAHAATPYASLHAAAACAQSPVAESVVVTRRACFELVWNAHTPRAVCMARMDDCEAQRQQLIAEPASFARFAHALAEAPPGGASTGCASVDAPPTGEPFAGACEWR